jgi:hypothetical protein
LIFMLKNVEFILLGRWSKQWKMLNVVLFIVNVEFTILNYWPFFENVEFNNLNCWTICFWKCWIYFIEYWR